MQLPLDNISSAVPIPEVEWQHHPANANGRFVYRPYGNIARGRGRQRLQSIEPRGSLARVAPTCDVLGYYSQPVPCEWLEIKDRECGCVWIACGVNRVPAALQIVYARLALNNPPRNRSISAESWRKLQQNSSVSDVRYCQAGWSSRENRRHA